MRIVLSLYIKEGCRITSVENSCYTEGLANTCDDNGGRRLKEISFLESMMLCRHDATVRRGEGILRQNLTFSLCSGERIGTCAPSGTGKTALGHALTG